MPRYMLSIVIILTREPLTTAVEHKMCVHSKAYHVYFNYYATIHLQAAVVHMVLNATVISF